MTNTKLFRSWCRWLRKHFPIRCDNLRILFCVPSHYPATQLGGCHWDQDELGYPKNVTIYVRPTLSVTQTADVLVHEYAHAYRAMLPHVGNCGDEDELHAIVERQIGNHWDKLRGEATHEEE